MNGAAAYDGELPESRPKPAFTAGQRRFLLQLARRTIEAAVRQQPLIAPDPNRLEAPLRECRSCFVTLEKPSGLRGCIGHLIPHEPLFQALIHAARQAALADPRFSRVQSDELGEIRIEISVLSSLIPLVYTSIPDLLRQLEPSRHGVVLQFGDRTCTFLPQVWEQIPDKTDFLDRLAQKGGWESSSWRNPQARFSIYGVESFHESPGIH
jgi:AmmeMemoRadiSam system protein A